MLQSTINFELLFKRGLSPNGLKVKNQNFFTFISNMHPSRTGFRTINKNEIKTISLNDGGAQTFSFDLGEFVFIKDKVFEIVGEKLVLKIGSGIPLGGRWYAANFGEDVVVTNGVCQVILTKINPPEVARTPIPYSKQLLFLNGQILISNVGMKYWNNIVPGTLANENSGRNMVAWSGIGGVANFVPSISNQSAGWRFIPELVEIKGMFRLGKDILILGSHGIVRMFAAGNTYGVQNIADFGVIDFHSSEGNGNVVYFFDNDKNLWKIDKDFSLTQLGYGDIFAPYASFKMFFMEEELYINVGAFTYCLNEFGLFSLNMQATGARNKRRFTVLKTPLFTDAYAMTSVLDFKDPGLKIIEEVSVGHETNEGDNVGVRIYTRVGQRPWVVSKTYILNEEGVCKPHVAGDEFKIEFVNTSFTTSILSYLHIQYTKLDKRFNRGHIFSDPNREG